MSVLIVTSLGDIVVDLHVDRCPLTSKNFLKLCKMKYYNECLFHKVEKDFLAQTGDRTGTGEGGDSVYKFLYGDQARFFDDEIHPELKHKRIGTVAMASAGKNLNASQFYFTLREDLDYLDGNHTVFGIVEEEEGLETLAKINEAFVDDKGRPYKNIRIKHTYILEDPFSDPAELSDFIPEKSPEGKPDDEVAPERLEDNWVPLDEKLGTAELEELIRAKEAHTNATILESIGDIPDADIKPPENVLFVCKLNPVTQDEDLHTIFSRFGNVTSADIIRDYKTGDSLCYAFIEFETTDACELAYTKMGDALIDDRRIKVDFSQSVAKLWNQYRHGRKRESKGSGCFKCGASDHIARDCPQATKSKENASNYVLKEDNRQRGGSHHRYDMVFDDNDPGTGRQSHGDKTGSGSKKQKIENHRSEDSVQKVHSTRNSDSRNYKNRHDYEYEDRGRHRGTDVRSGDRSRDDDHRDKAYRRRDTDVHDRDRETERYLDSGTHARREDSSNKKSSDSSQRARDARIDGDTKAVSSLDNGADHDYESRERKREKYDERRENSRHHESSRRGKDDNGRHRSPDLGRSDHNSRDRRHRDDKRR